MAQFTTELHVLDQATPRAGAAQSGALHSRPDATSTAAQIGSTACKVEEAGLMCAASGRAARCFIFLTVPCTGLKLGEGPGTALRHNGWRHPFRFNFSICSVAGSGRNAFIFNAGKGCQCRITTMHMSHDRMNESDCERCQVKSNLGSAGSCSFRSEGKIPLIAPYIVTALQRACEYFCGASRF